jgi:hypothetical protein
MAIPAGMLDYLMERDEPYQGGEIYGLARDFARRKMERERLRASSIPRTKGEWLERLSRGQGVVERTRARGKPFNPRPWERSGAAQPVVPSEAELAENLRRALGKQDIGDPLEVPVIGSPETEYLADVHGERMLADRARERALQDADRLRSMGQPSVPLQEIGRHPYADLGGGRPGDDPEYQQWLRMHKLRERSANMRIKNARLMQQIDRSQVQRIQEMLKEKGIDKGMQKRLRDMLQKHQRDIGVQEQTIKEQGKALSEMLNPTNYGAFLEQVLGNRS